VLSILLLYRVGVWVSEKRKPTPIPTPAGSRPEVTKA